MLTLAQMRTQVRTALGNRSDHTDAFLEENINLSQMRIARLNQWEELERVFDNTLAITADPRSDKQFTLPDASNTDTNVDIRDAYSFRLITNDGKSKKLIFRTPRQFDELHPEPEYFARDTPSIYTKYGNTIEMYPVPDTAYPVRVRATIWPTTLTDANPTSLLDRKDDLIISLTTAWLFYLQRNPEEAGRWLRVFKDDLLAALKEQSEIPDLDVLSDFEAAIKHGRNTGEWWNDPFVRDNL